MNKRPLFVPVALTCSITIATKETGLDFEAFPEECPWGYAEIVNVEFWPE